MGSIRQIFSEGHERWLDDSAILWRYVPLRTLFLYLTGSIFIPSVEKLRQGDPFEGEFYFDRPWFNQALHNRYGDDHEQVIKWLHNRLSPSELNTLQRQKRLGVDIAAIKTRYYEKYYFEFLRKTRYAWCWFAANIESAAMWNTYGSQGVAIATTIEKLSEILLKTENNFAFGQMCYVAVNDEQATGLVLENPKDSQLILEPHFLKRTEYKSENEVRFVTTSNEHEHDPGIYLPRIKPEEWIQEILFWPKLDSSEVSSLKNVVKKFAPRLACNKSGLLSRKPKSNKTLMRAVGLLDDKAWKNGSDGIPDILKNP